MSVKVRTGVAERVPTVTHLPVSLYAEIFEHVPDTAFFVKDTAGRYTAVNQSLAERVGFQRTEDLVGKTVREVYPTELATRFARQDETGTPSGRSSSGAHIDQLDSPKSGCIPADRSGEAD